MKINDLSSVCGKALTGSQAPSRREDVFYSNIALPGQKKRFLANFCEVSQGIFPRMAPLALANFPVVDQNSVRGKALTGSSRLPAACTS